MIYPIGVFVNIINTFNFYREKIYIFYAKKYNLSYFTDTIKRDILGFSMIFRRFESDSYGG